MHRLSLKHRRHASLVDIFLMIGKQMGVEILSLAQLKAKNALDLRATLNHLLTHS